VNALDGKQIDLHGFSYRDLLGQDAWITFTPAFGSLTVVGATNYSGRLRIVGKQCQFQVQFSAATSIASTAGTDYLTLPIPGCGCQLVGNGGHDERHDQHSGRRLPHRSGDIALLLADTSGERQHVHVVRMV
jgi:hypothetical protein